MATAAACLLFSSGAQAQTAPGQRYMTWANRPASTVPGDVAAVRARVANGMIPRRVAPSQAVNRPSLQSAGQPIPVSRGLTPASAWIGPRTTPAFAPGNPDPISYATTEMEAPLAREPAPVAPAPVRTAPAYTAPVMSAPAEPLPAETASADPMAPRRDAPIFRMQQTAATGAQQTAPAQAAPAPAQGQVGARYYSVHRDAGRQPDPTVMPDPVFFDSVTLDLAEPPQTQAPVRDAQGRRRPVANDDPSLP